MKTYLIIGGLWAAFLVASATGAYFAGRSIGRSGAQAVCAEQIAANEAARTAATIAANNAAAAKIIEQKRKINNETFTTSAADIRGILRAKYTIAD